MKIKHWLLGIVLVSHSAIVQADTFVLGIGGDLSDPNSKILTEHFNRITQHSDLRVTHFLPEIRVAIVEVKTQSRSFLKAWQKDGTLRYYEAVEKIRHREESVPAGLAITPNDPSLKKQWGLTRLRLPEAWMHTTGSAGIPIAVIDTGIDADHPEFQGRLWRNEREIPSNGIDDDQNGYVDDLYGWDFLGNDAEPDDENGHGTHVAGITGAASDNRVGGSGVAWQNPLMTLKVLDAQGSGNTGYAIAALHYAVKNGARIINCSWGGYNDSKGLRDAITYALQEGVLVVAAAGNDANNNDVKPHYPSSVGLDNVLSVAALNSSGALASFSNYGLDAVHLAAPGEKIYSTFKGSAYRSMQGTSMAAPFVAGVAGLILAKNPALEGIFLRNAILNAITSSSQLSGQVVVGGELNAALALSQESAGPQLWPARVTLRANAAGSSGGRSFGLTLFAVDSTSVTSWSSANPSILEVKRHPNDPLRGIVTPLRTGETEVIVRTDTGLELKSRVTIKTAATSPPSGGGGCQKRADSSKTEKVGAALSGLLPLLFFPFFRRRPRSPRDEAKR